jgi:capsular polysaccharide export protein
MNIAYLDPPYSRHFQHLAASLTRRTGGSSVALLSSAAYRLYTGADRSLLWPGATAAPAHCVPPDFEQGMLVDARASEFLGVFSHAVEWLHSMFVRERIEICLVFSDVRPFSVAARLAAEAAGVVCVYFERGAYRYGTSSLSTSGLNARFSLSRARAGEPICGVAEDMRILRRAQEPRLKLRFAAFLAWNKLARLRHPPLRRLQHKNYELRRYLRLGVRQWVANWRGDAPVPGLDGDGGHRPVVLVPLQLETDSQFLIGSPFRDNCAFMGFVVPQILLAQPDARILIKKHPMDPGDYRLPPGAELVHGNLSRLFPQTSLLVCINSTVGFEAATRGKRVLCFGESFYTEGALVTRVTRDDFSARVRTSIEAGDDVAAGQALRAAVLRHYQAPGDAWAYTDEDIEATADIVLQRVRAARKQDALQASINLPARQATG